MQEKNLVRTRTTFEGRGPRREYVKLFLCVWQTKEAHRYAMGCYLSIS